MGRDTRGGSRLSRHVSVSFRSAGFYLLDGGGRSGLPLLLDNSTRASQTMKVKSGSHLDAGA